MYKNISISKEFTLTQVLKKMDAVEKKLLIVLQENKFFGLVSIGDIQRAIINNISLDTNVTEILRSDIKLANPNDTFESIKAMMIKYRIELCPIVDNNNNILKIYFWEDIFKDEKIQPFEKFDLPIVVMAGGIGSRLKPLTNVLPKPLIPIGDDTIIENIFKRFSNHGCSQFFISVNYKADLISYYLKSQKLPYNLEFFIEDKPMGTAGSLSLLKGKIKKTFFVSNCDILIDQDYSEILNYHKKNKNEITIIAVIKNQTIPYGTIETGANGELINLTEKPEITFKVNSGMYILEPHLLDQIPDNKFFHITHLIEKIKQRNGKVGVFPINNNSWKDIGIWSEYLKTINI